MRLPFRLLLPLFLLSSQTVPAQRSIMQIESERHAAIGERSEAGWDSLRPVVSRSQAASVGDCRLTHTVFGWHPYWSGTAYTDYDWSLLSDVAYFSYEVDPATGSYTSIHGWLTTPMIDVAKEHGVRVHLAVTLFGSHATFFSSAAAQQGLIDSLISLVKQRGGSGVNIDFEGVPASQRASFAAWMGELGRRFHAEIPGSIVSIAIPAVDWSSSFDVAAMSPFVDLFIMMGYDYHWRGASVAGPVAPRHAGSLWGSIDVRRSIDTWLGRGIPRAKLLLGVPWYGYEWPTADSTIGAATLGAGSAVLYATAADRAEQEGRRWEPQSMNPWYRYRRGDQWRQVWYDDQVSIGAKYDLARQRDLGGIGIWALGYDAGRSEMKEAIREHFTSCGTTTCEGTFVDMGGSGGNYPSPDSFIFTIAPEGGRDVALSFYSFGIGDDTLAAYDGSDTTAPLIGRWSGQSSPGTIRATSGAMTLRFVAGGENPQWGWTASWSCSTVPTGAPLAGAEESVVRLAPNPARRTVLSLQAGTCTLASVTDLRGRERARIEIQPTTGHLTIDADQLGLERGNYFVRLKGERGERVVRWVVAGD